MNRKSESQLVAFCVEQHGHFDAAAWGRVSSVTALELAVVARYLAGVAWYGHHAALGEVAAQLSPRQFADLARETNFDAARFAGLLRAHLHHAGRLATA